MPKKRYTPEEIVAKLRQVDVLVSQGQNIADAIRQIGVSEVTYYRWRQEYGGLKADQVKRLKQLEQENSRLRRAVSDLTLDKLICRRLPGATFKPRASSRLYQADQAVMHVSERRACAALGQHRSTQRKVPRGREDEERLTADTIALARQYGRYGYRKIAGLLEQAGWLGQRQAGRADLAARGAEGPPENNPSAAGSGFRMDHASGCGPSTAITSGPTTLSRTAPTMAGISMLNVIDEFTHECLAIRVARKEGHRCDRCSVRSLHPARRARPYQVRQRPEFVAKAVQEWITAVGAKTAYITLGSPWENPYVESFNARLRDELLDGEIFYTLREAQIVIESWRRHFNTIRPHVSLGYKPPAPEVFVPAFAAWPAALRQPASLATLAPRLVLN